MFHSLSKPAVYTLLLSSLACSASAPQIFASAKLNATELTDLAKTGSSKLHDAITATFERKDLKEGTAWAGRGPDFFFALEIGVRPELIIDDAAGPAMRPLADSNLWYAAARIERLGKLHSFHYLLDGHKFGGKMDVP